MDSNNQDNQDLPGPAGARSGRARRKPERAQQQVANGIAQAHADGVYEQARRNAVWRERRLRMSRRTAGTFVHLGYFFVRQSGSGLQLE